MKNCGMRAIALYLTSIKRCIITQARHLNLFKNLEKIPYFISTLSTYNKTNGRHEFLVQASEIYPMLADAGQEAGSYRGHYFFQDLWAARKIYNQRPKKHIDIGSRIDGFISHLLVFMPVTVLDVRDLNSDIEELSFHKSDATDLSDFGDNSVESISSLHAVEHFGLGRYGDHIDPEACFKAMAEISRVLKPGGRFYFSVPIGRERIQFNAHRIFSPLRILNVFSNLTLVSFSAVNDSGEFELEAAVEKFIDSDYSCGLFEFTKELRDRS